MYSSAVTSTVYPSEKWSSRKCTEVLGYLRTTGYSTTCTFMNVTFVVCPEAPGTDLFCFHLKDDDVVCSSSTTTTTTTVIIMEVTEQQLQLLTLKCLTPEVSD